MTTANAPLTGQSSINHVGLSSTCSSPAPAADGVNIDYHGFLGHHCLPLHLNLVQGCLYSVRNHGPAHVTRLVRCQSVICHRSLFIASGTRGIIGKLCPNGAARTTRAQAGSFADASSRALRYLVTASAVGCTGEAKKLGSPIEGGMGVRSVISSDCIDFCTS